jgi:hypothetical protein
MKKNLPNLIIFKNIIEKQLDKLQHKQLQALKIYFLSQKILLTLKIMKKSTKEFFSTRLLDQNFCLNWFD